MTSVISSALAGMQSATKRLEVSASNIANSQLNTSGSDANQDQLSLSDLANKLQPGGHDITNDIIEQHVASYDFKASLKVLKVNDEMMQSLLDIQS